MRGSILLALWGWALAQTAIPFWHTAGPPGDGVLLKAIQGFHETQSAYRLEARFMGDYREAGVKLLAALRSGGAPALFQAELSFLPRLAGEGQALALDPYLRDLPSDLYPWVWEMGRVGSKVYGLPLGASVPVLYLNQDAFQARGLKPPRTWAEVEAAARVLTGRSSKGMVISTDIWSFNAVVMSLGGSLIQEGRPNFTSKEVLEALEILYRMVRAGHAQARNLAEAQFAVADFLRTKAFMGLAPSTALPVVLERTRLPFTVGLAPLPRAERGRVPLSGAVLVVLKGASPEQAQGAAAFWRHFLDLRLQAEWARTTWYLPLRRGAEGALRDLLEGPGRAVFAQAEWAEPWSQEPKLLLWYGLLEEALEKSLKGGVPPRQALEEAQRRALSGR